MQKFITETMTQKQLISIFEMIGTFWILLLDRDKPKDKSDDTNQINQEIYGMRQPDF